MEDSLRRTLANSETFSEVDLAVATDPAFRWHEFPSRAYHNFNAAGMVVRGFTAEQLARFTAAEVWD